MNPVDKDVFVKRKNKWTTPLIHRMEYFVFRLVVCIIDALPFRVATRLAEQFAWVIHRCLPKKLTRYYIAKENLQTAFGESLSDKKADAIILGMWVHLFRMITEIVLIPRKLRLFHCSDILTFRNRDETVRAFCSGRPVIMLSGHFGNWEIANVIFGLFGFPMGIVARDLDNPLLHNWFAKWRIGTGHRLIPKKGGGGEIAQTLERGGSLAMLGDQDAGSGGLFVPFFGKDASTFKSIALVAMQYDALICVGYTRRLKEDTNNDRWMRYELGCEEIIDPRDFQSADAVREITACYSAAIERMVRLSPEQYFWIHRRWKSKPKQRKRRKPKTDISSAA